MLPLANLHLALPRVDFTVVYMFVLELVRVLPDFLALSFGCILPLDKPRGCIINGF
jgi:hypothetical protein